MKSIFYNNLLSNLNNKSNVAEEISKTVEEKPKKLQGPKTDDKS